MSERVWVGGVPWSEVFIVLELPLLRMVFWRGGLVIFFFTSCVSGERSGFGGLSLFETTTG